MVITPSAVSEPEQAGRVSVQAKAESTQPGTLESEQSEESSPQLTQYVGAHVERTRHLRGAGAVCDRVPKQVMGT